VKILVIGTVIFTKNMLEQLINSQANIVGVVTSDANEFNADYVDLTPLCKKQKIPCVKTWDINNEETLEWVRNQQPDVILCLGWSQLIKPTLLSIPPKGVIGFHPSELPKNRGRHPIIWALVLGLQETASTFFVMNEGTDSGGVVSQEKIAINAQDDAGTLYQKVVKTAGSQIVKLVTDLEQDSIMPVPQNDTEANVWRKRDTSDGKIDWRMSAKSIHNLVRGLTHPYVGADFDHHGEVHKVWRTRLLELEHVENIEPGKVMAKGSNGYIVRCGEGCIELCDIEPVIALQEGDYL
jgi:methionyl-tRNA formyltransferase